MGRTAPRGPLGVEHGGRPILFQPTLSQRPPLESGSQNSSDTAATRVSSSRREAMRRNITKLLQSESSRSTSGGEAIVSARSRSKGSLGCRTCNLVIPPVGRRYYQFFLLLFGAPAVALVPLEVVSHTPGDVAHPGVLHEDVIVTYRRLQASGPRILSRLPNPPNIQSTS